MIVKIGETRSDVMRAGSYRSISVNVYAVAAAVDNALVDSDVSPSSVGIKVVLKRNGKQTVLMQDNLQLLGVFNTLLKGYNEFSKGIVLTAAAAQVKEVRLYPVVLDFGGFLRVNTGDELSIEVAPSLAGFLSANVDSSLSYVEFQAIAGIGLEEGIFQTITEVVQSNTTKQSFSPGDNVVKVALLNLDKTDYSAQVVSSLNFASDRWDESLSFNQLLGLSLQNFDDVQRYPNNGTLPALPQSFLLFDGVKLQAELDTVKVDIAFNSANVNSSKNYLVSQKYITDVATVQAYIDRNNKFVAEKLSKIK